MYLTQIFYGNDIFKSKKFSGKTITILKSLAINSIICVTSGPISIDWCFPPHYGMYFPTSLPVRLLEKGSLIIKGKQDNFILSFIHKQVSFIQLSVVFFFNYQFLIRYY